MKELIDKYTKLYKAALTDNKISDAEAKTAAFEQRLTQMYNSETFVQHNVYPSMNVLLVYAVIAMCIELKKHGFSDEDTILITNSAFEKRRNSFRFLYKIINNLPFSYKIAEKWNVYDHEKRLKDGSITYDFFNVSEGKLEYRISRCMYIEMFEYYGIRSLCKIFCLTDEYAYAHIDKNIGFIRHSDLCCGDCCHDEVFDKKFLSNRQR